MSAVDVSGLAPKTFMSRAASHAVGGDGGAGVSTVVAGDGISQEKGSTGPGDGLSLRVIVVVEEESQLKPCLIYPVM